MVSVSVHISCKPNSAPVSCKKEEMQNEVIERKSRESHLGGGISVSNYRERVCNPPVSSALCTEITQSTFQSKYSLRVNTRAHLTRPDYHFFKGIECSIVSGR